MVPVITFFVLFFVSCAALILTSGETIGAKDSRIVKLYLDGKQRDIPTRSQSVGELLSSLNVELHDQDVVEPARDTPISSNNFSVNIYRARPVTIVDATGQKTVAKLAEREPAEIAKRAGLTIYPEDKFNIAPPSTTMQDNIIGEKIVIDRALPIKLSLYGTTYDIRTQANTVADLVSERGIHFTEASVLPSPSTQLKANDIVFVTEVGKQISVVEESIPQPVEYVDSVDLELGTNKVREEGVPGKKAVVYDIAQDGSKKPLQEIVVMQPVRKLVARGAKPKPGFDGGFDAALARLRSCEGSYTSINYAGGYYGAYQFNLGTWRTNAPASYVDVRPDQAPPAVQDEAAKTLYSRRGWQPWPSCSIKLGLQDIYR